MGSSNQDRDNTHSQRKRNRKDADISNPSHTIGISAYSDSAYGDNSERKSSAGYIVKMAGGVVSFKLYRQRLVTLSSTESEYIALTYAAKEVSWVQHLLTQVGYVGNDLRPLQLYTDNQPALNMICKDGNHKRTKHIDAYLKYMKQHYKDGNVKLYYVSGANMPADSLTKPLDKNNHAKFLKLINMVTVSCMYYFLLAYPAMQLPENALTNILHTLLT
jgi:hypothetical protein